MNIVGGSGNLQKHVPVIRSGAAGVQFGDADVRTAWIHVPDIQFEWEFKIDRIGQVAIGDYDDAFDGMKVSPITRHDAQHVIEATGKLCRLQLIESAFSRWSS